MRGPFGMPPGPTGLRILQRQRINYRTAFSAAGLALPADATIPQASETTLVTQLDITPRATGSKLLIRVQFFGQIAGPADDNVALCLFRSDSTSALEAVGCRVRTSDDYSLSVFHELTTINTSKITLQMRVGCSSTNTTIYNSLYYYGAVPNTYIDIMEVIQG